MRVLFAVGLFLVSGCIGLADDDPSVQWTQTPAVAKSGEQFRTSYTIQQATGFKEADSDVLAAPKSADAANLEVFTLNLDPDADFPVPVGAACPRKTDFAYTECDQNTLQDAPAPGHYWIRVRAVVDGEVVWSKARALEVRP